MKKRISEEDRRKIKDATRLWSARKIAFEHKVSKTTVQLWKHRTEFKDKPRLKKLEITEFEEDAFREVVRLSRYRPDKLFEYLAPVWGGLPSQGREEDPDNEGGYLIDPLTRKLYTKVTPPSHFKLAMKRCGLSKYYDRSSPHLHAVAAHRVRVNWKYSNGSTIEGDLLILIHRSSGLIYGKAFTERVKPEMFKTCLGRMERMLSFEVHQVDFVTSNESSDSQNKTESYTTVLRMEVRPPARGKSERRVNSEKLRDLMPNREILPCADDDTPHQKRRIELPGTYNGKSDLNKRIEDIVNLINLTKRRYSLLVIDPQRFLLKSARKFRATTTEREIKNRIKLPLKRKTSGRG